MSKHKYFLKTRAGRLAFFLLIVAMACDGIAIRYARRYYPYTDIKNPNVEWLVRCNWFYINLWLFLDFLIVIPSLAVFHLLPESTKEVILAASIVLGIISFTIALHNLILITWS